MTTFFSFLKQHKIPRRDSLRQILSGPLSWYGLTLYALMVATVVATYILILSINSHFLVTVPARGGTITEGVIGAPHVINPIIATTNTDISLTKLIFSGLVTAKGDGTIRPELAASYTVSPDGLVYAFTLQDNLKWSDKKPLTSADVVFTYAKLVNLHPNSYWQDVTISAPDAQTIIFTLPQTRNDFLEHVTIGIIPQHIWGDVADEVFDTAPANLRPVGSGPYKFENMTTQNGVPRELSLVANPHYAQRRPYIDSYTVEFFANQQELLTALKDGALDMTLAASPATAAALTSDRYIKEHRATQNIVGVFHIQNDPLFGDTRFIETLNRAIDKNAILATVEHGYGILPSTPASVELMSLEESFLALKALGYDYSDGTLYKNNAPIGFSIAVENDPTLLLAARALASQLGHFGIIVDIKAYDRGTFQEGIRTNEYQTFFASTREGTTPYETVFPLYTKAIPLIRTTSTRVVLPSYLDSPNDRYRDTTDWYIKTSNVWRIFSNSNNKQ